MLDFDSILANDTIKKSLMTCVHEKRLSHAYIIAGDAGSGKKTLAFALAKLLLCQNPVDDKPCCDCHTCTKVEALSHPDLFVVGDADGSSIGVDEIRDRVSHTIRIAPYYGGHKIYIIENAEKLTVQSQNALLKTIEEPPEYAIIMLLTTNEKVFLDTIRSRCVTLKMQKLPFETISNAVGQRGVSPQEADIIAAFSSGSLGRALAILDDEKFRERYVIATDILKAIPSSDVADIPAYARQIASVYEKEAGDFLDLCSMWYRDILVRKRCGAELIFRGESASIDSLATSYKLEDISKILASIQEARSRLASNVNAQMVVEAVLLDMT